MVRRTASGVITEPDSCRASSSRRVRSANATSSALPRRVTRLPRTWMSAARFSSSSRSSASREPSRPIICRSSATTSVDSPTERSVSARGQLRGTGHLIGGTGGWEGGRRWSRHRGEGRSALRPTGNPAPGALPAFDGLERSGSVGYPIDSTVGHRQRCHLIDQLGARARPAAGVSPEARSATGRRADAGARGTRSDRRRHRC